MSRFTETLFYLCISSCARVTFCRFLLALFAPYFHTSVFVTGSRVTVFRHINSLEPYSIPKAHQQPKHAPFQSNIRAGNSIYLLKRVANVYQNMENRGLILRRYSIKKRRGIGYYVLQNISPSYCTAV